MNELVWEGLLEIVREGQPSLKASARLWRRDDFFGSDWGGQLELPVVFRRLLPAEDYLVRLPSGVEGRVRIAAGPSTTTMTFPTLTGIGNPPFGTRAGDAPAPDAEAAFDDEADTAAPESEPSRGGTERPARSASGRQGRATSRSARANADPDAAGAAAVTPATTLSAVVPIEAPVVPPQPAPVAEPLPSPVAIVAAEPVPAPRERPLPVPVTAPAVEATPTAAARSTGSAARQAQRARSTRSRSQRTAQGARPPGPDVEASVEQTESLARAFLAAVEARGTLLPLERDGFEGRAIRAARQDVELIAATIEGALRSADGATQWADDLRHQLTVAAWFASVATPDEQPDVAAAGAAVDTLLATIDAVLSLRGEDIALGGAGDARAA